MIAREPVGELARNLQLLNNGRDGSHIVQWLRAHSSQVMDVPPPNRAPGGYTRTLLHKGQGFEILVLHWQPGCASPIHDHGGARCWFAVCEGSMRIENFLRYDSGQVDGHARIRLQGRETLERGDLDYRQDDVHLHRCIAGPDPVKTLHVYAAPIERFMTFDEQAERCREISAAYDAILTAF